MRVFNNINLILISQRTVNPRTSLILSFFLFTGSNLAFGYPGYNTLFIYLFQLLQPWTHKSLSECLLDKMRYCLFTPITTCSSYVSSYTKCVLLNQHFFLPQTPKRITISKSWFRHLQ